MENNPYAPPASSIQGTPELVPDETTSGFRDLGGISGKLSMLLLIGVGVKILVLVASLMQINLSPLVNNPRRVQVLLVLGPVALYIATAVVFGRWIYLAQRNLPELGARLLRFTPGWSVGCFFIPLVSLWAPCQAMNQLVRASRNPRQWELEDTPAVIGIWWTLWLISQVGGGLFGALLGAKTAAMPYSATQLRIASIGLSVVLYVLAWLIVRRVWRDQSETYAQMGGAPAP